MGQPPPPQFDPSPPLAIDAVLRESIRVFGADPLRYSVLTFGASVPIVILQAVIATNPNALITQIRTLDGAEDPSALLITLLPVIAGVLGVGLLSVVLAGMAQAAVTFGAVEHLAGRKPSFSDLVMPAFTRFLPLMGSLLIVGIARGIGFMLCCIPGLFILTVTAVTVPLVVVEKRGPIESLERSFKLTEGYRVEVFAALLVAWVTIWIVSFCVGLIMAPIAVGLAFAGPAGQAIQSLPQQLVAAPITALLSVVGAVIYARLRRAKEGVDTASLAEVFR